MNHDISNSINAVYPKAHVQSSVTMSTTNQTSPNTVSLTQSPVNISTADTPTQAFANVLESHYQSAPIEIFNNGENIDGEFTTQQNYVIYQGEKFYLNGFHLHTKSEHTFNGQNNDGEIHFVHQSDSGKKLVVGILLNGESTDGDSDDPGIDSPLSPFFGKLDDALKDTSKIVDGGNFDPSKLISGSSQVYHYGGSLTTSPYTDAAWVVAAKPLTVSEEDLQKFRDLQKDFYYGENPNVDANGFNFREIQNELFLGTDGIDSLTGDRKSSSGLTDDLIYARGGNDTVDGGLGNDKIFGGQGRDLLIGGAGDDLLDGGADIDTLTGLAGADTFVLRVGDSNDTITDYTDGTDRLGLAGGLSFEELYFTESLGSIEIRHQDANGEILATLANVVDVNLTREDFVIV